MGNSVGFALLEYGSQLPVAATERFPLPTQVRMGAKFNAETSSIMSLEVFQTGAIL